MILPRCGELAVISLLIAAPSALRAQDILAISAKVGRPCSFTTSTYGELISSSLVIQNALLAAFVLEAGTVEIDFDAVSKAIKRVKPFGLGGQVYPTTGKFIVSRIATQRKNDGSDEHLEVEFQGDAKFHNVYDPFLQQVLIAAFGSRDLLNKPLLVDVEFDKGEIVTVAFNRSRIRKSK